MQPLRRTASAAPRPRGPPQRLPPPSEEEEAAHCRPRATRRLLLALPRPGKALLKAIGRGEDVGTTGSEAVTVEPIRKADGTVNETATAIKLIRNLGGTRVA